ncbi:hypothetical protein ACV33L_30545, partial [Pseudomonas aeruginosa]
MNNSFWKAGHAPTLFAAFLYFDLSFMVWYVLGPLGVQIAGADRRGDHHRALLVAPLPVAGNLHPQRAAPGTAHTTQLEIENRREQPPGKAD